MDHYTFSIKNFKSLKENIEIELKPITLLFGPNNSGKSSVIHSILILKEAMKNTENDQSISLNNKYTQLGTFKDTIYEHDETKNFEFNFQIESDNKKASLNFQLGLVEGILMLKNFLFEFRDGSILINNKEMTIQDVYGNKNIIKSNNYKLNNISYELLFNPVEYTQLYDYLKQEIKFFDKQSQFYSDQMDDSMPVNQIHGTMHDIEKSKERTFELKSTIEDMFGLKQKVEDNIYFIRDSLLQLDFFNNKLRTFLQNVTVIGPLRNPFLNYYLVPDKIFDSVGMQGENFAPILLKLLERRESLDRLNTWLKKLDISSNIILKKFEEIRAVYLLNPILNTPINLTNLGFGISQLLPILVEGIYKKNSLIIIQQPELHLHPKLQGDIADFLIYSHRENNNTFLIESHSEHILLRLQRRIAEGELDRREAAIFNLELTENGSKIFRISLNENGTLNEWPKGFFDEDIEDSKEILRSIAGEKKD